MDRRTAYTRMIIKQSFLNLLSTKNLEQITIKEICLDANINRATFYRNYKDLYDLFEEIEKDMMQEAFPNGIAAYDLNQLLEVIYKNQVFYREFLNHHLESVFIKNMTAEMKQSFAHTLKENNVYNEQDYNAYFHFAIHGATGLLREWLSNGCVPAPQKFSTLLLTMCYNLFHL